MISKNKRKFEKNYICTLDSLNVMKIEFEDHRSRSLFVRQKISNNRGKSREDKLPRGCLYFAERYTRVQDWSGRPVDLSSETIYGGSSVKLISKHEGGRSNLRPARKWSVLKRAERVGQFMTRN